MSESALSGRSDTQTDLKRSFRFETLADLGNGVKVESYWPEYSFEDGRDPLIYVRQGASAAPLMPAQLRPLIEALERVEEFMWRAGLVEQGGHDEAGS